MRLGYAAAKSSPSGGATCRTGASTFADPPGRSTGRRGSGSPKVDGRVAISETFARRLGDWYAVSVIERGADAAGYVWPGQKGGPMDAHTPTQAAARALDRAGLVDTDGVPLVTLHGLRHTAASIMLSRGVPLIVVSRQLGHADPKITASTYAHLLGDSELDRAATVFDTLGAAGTLRETLRGTDGSSETTVIEPDLAET